MTQADMLQQLLHAWMHDPVKFVRGAIGVEPDPWQADVLDAVEAHDNVAIRAAHGVGKTAVLSWAIVWFLMTRPLAKVPTTAPTFNKQVRDVLWAEVHRTLRLLNARLPLLAKSFELHTTRLRAQRSSGMVRSRSGFQ
jgi:phage terminase large subunit